MIADELNCGFTRNAICGRIHRLGISPPGKPPKISKPRAPRTTTVTHKHVIERLVRAVNNNIYTDRRFSAVETAEYKLRCVEIIPRNISVLELEANDCRYPYGGDDQQITFCGHPKMAGSSYCCPHFHLTRRPPPPLKPLARKYQGVDFARGAA